MRGLFAAPRATLVALAALLLCGCGGGGESGSSSGNSPGSNSPPSSANAVSVSFSKGALALTGDTTLNNAPIDTSVSFTITNRPASGVWTRLTASGAAVASGSVNWTSQDQGYINIFTRPPQALGAGTYTGTLKMEVCPDSQCASQVAGSPATINVTYVVTGSADPQTEVYWSGGLVSGPFNTTQTSAPQFKLGISVTNLPYPSLYLRARNQVGDIFTNVVLGSPTFTPNRGTAFGEYTVTLKPPAALGSGEFRGSIDFEACFDAACSRVVPGSGYTMRVGFLVLATEGADYVLRTVAPPQGASEVVWSAANQSFYILSNRDATRGFEPGVDPQIARVDPATLQVGPSVTIPGENLRRLSVTADGTRLYAASAIHPSVYRFNLPALSKDLTIPLDGPLAGESYVAFDIAMLPGQPRSFVASLALNNSVDGGIRVYDDATSRTHSVAPPARDFAERRWLVPAETPGNFLSPQYVPPPTVISTWERLVVDGSGVSTSSTAPATSGPYAGRPVRAGNRIYTLDGKVLDASTGAQVGTLGESGGSSASAIVVDEAHGRLFQWGGGFLWVYDLATLQRLAIAQINVAASWTLEPTMVLWGTEGVALADHDKLVVLSGPLFTTYRGQPTM